MSRSSRVLRLNGLWQMVGSRRLMPAAHNFATSANPASQIQIPPSINMKANVTKRGTDQGQIGPDQLTRESHFHPFRSQRHWLCIDKRRRGFKDEDSTEHTRKSPRTQQSRQYPCIHTTVHCQCRSWSAANRRHRNVEDRFQQSSRKSSRLQKIHDLNQQRVKQTEKWTRSSFRTIRTSSCIEQKSSHDEQKSLKASKKCQLTLCCAFYAVFSQSKSLSRYVNSHTIL